MKILSYSNVRYTPGVPLILLTLERVKYENFDFGLFSFSVCFFSFMHNLKSVLHIQMICTPNDSSTIKDFHSLS